MLFDVAVLHAAAIAKLDGCPEVEYGVAVVDRLVGVGVIERGEFDIAARHRLDPSRYPIGLIFVEPGYANAEGMAVIVWMWRLRRKTG